MNNIKYLIPIIGIVFSLGCVDGGIRQREVVSDTVNQGGGLPLPTTPPVEIPTTPGEGVSSVPTPDPLPSNPSTDSVHLQVMSVSPFKTQLVSSQNTKFFILSSNTQVGAETGSSGTQVKDALSLALQKSLIQ